MSENFDMRAALDETRRGLDDQAVGSKAIKETANIIFGASSLLVALMSVSIFSGHAVDSSSVGLYKLMVSGVMVLFPILIALCLIVQMPVKFVVPIKQDWDVIMKAFDGKEERKVLEQQISNNLNAHSKNVKTLMCRRCLVIAAGVAMILIVLLIVGINLLPRV